MRGLCTDQNSTPHIKRRENQSKTQLSVIEIHLSLLKGKTCQSPSLIAEHFPGTVTYFTTCCLPPFTVCTFNLLPKSDNVVTFYQIYLHFPKHFLFTSPSSKPLFMYLTHIPSCFGAISSKNKFPAVCMLLSHLTFSFYNF
jgi:hypothetical protein